MPSTIHPSVDVKILNMLQENLVIKPAKVSNFKFVGKLLSRKAKRAGHKAEFTLKEATRVVVKRAAGQEVTVRNDSTGSVVLRVGPGPVQNHQTIILQSGDYNLESRYAV